MTRGWGRGRDAHGREGVSWRGRDCDSVPSARASTWRRVALRLCKVSALGKPRAGRDTAWSSRCDFPWVCNDFGTKRHHGCHECPVPQGQNSDPAAPWLPLAPFPGQSLSPQTARSGQATRSGTCVCGCCWAVGWPCPSVDYGSQAEATRNKWQQRDPVSLGLKLAACKVVCSEGARVLSKCHQAA